MKKIEILDWEHINKAQTGKLIGDAIKDVSHELIQKINELIDAYNEEHKTMSKPFSDKTVAAMNNTECFCEHYCKEKNGQSIKIDENTSDGYHTFKELYDHRIALFFRQVIEKLNELIDAYNEGQKV